MTEHNEIKEYVFKRNRARHSVWEAHCVVYMGGGDRERDIPNYCKCDFPIANNKVDGTFSDEVIYLCEKR